jgi:hypothetical protein
VTHRNAAVAVSLIVLFFFTQRTFVQGITMTGLTGSGPPENCVTLPPKQGKGQADRSHLDDNRRRAQRPEVSLDGA